MMDKSKELIAMAACPEIQDEWRPEVGDITNEGLVHDVKMFAVNMPLLFINKRKYWYYETIFTPRQDQIQEMCPTNDPFLLLEVFSEWGLSEDRMKDNTWKVTSLEQLWLSFFMWNSHKKKWNGDKWVSDSD